jgi:hypothetical protein
MNSVNGFTFGKSKGVISIFSEKMFTLMKYDYANIPKSKSYFNTILERNVQHSYTHTLDIL